jgi:uncharacterized membrane protein
MTQLFATALFLQAPTQEHILFASEKIFAVLAVVLIVWVGVLVQLFRVEQKARRLEQIVADLQAEKQ